MSWPRAGCALALAGALLGVACGAPSGAAATLFGLVSTGELHASADGGAHWTVRAALPVRDAVALVAGLNPSQLVLASASGSVYRSANAGATWAAVGAVPARDVVAFAGRTGKLLLFTATGAVYASTDVGGTWSAVGAIPAADLVAATGRPFAVYALARSGAVYRSADDGATWTAIGALATTDAVGLQELSGTMLALTGAGDAAVSGDGGLWFAGGTLSQVGCAALTAANGEWVAATAAGEVAASGDGVAWAWRGAIGQLAVRALANDTPALVGVDDGGGRAFRLSAPWPSPARGAVAFTLELAAPARVRVAVLDAGGREVARPVDDEALPAGTLTRRWDAPLPAGVYWLRATAGGETLVRRFVRLAAR